MKLALRVLAVVCALYLLLVVRAVLESRAAHAHGLRALGAGDVPAAIAHLRRAARWYAPGNPYASEALDVLLAVGERAQRDNEPERALSAYRAVHATIHAAASFYLPHPERLAVADQQIAALMGARRPPEIDAHLSRPERAAAYRRALDGRGPRLGFVLFGLAGFALWVAAVLRLCLRGLDREDRPLPAARPLGYAAAVGFGAFAVGLAFA